MKITAFFSLCDCLPCRSPPAGGSWFLQYSFYTVLRCRVSSQTNAVCSDTIKRSPMPHDGQLINARSKSALPELAANTANARTRWKGKTRRRKIRTRKRRRIKLSGELQEDRPPQAAIRANHVRPFFFSPALSVTTRPQGQNNQRLLTTGAKVPSGEGKTRR